MSKSSCNSLVLYFFGEKEVSQYSHKPVTTGLLGKKKLFSGGGFWVSKISL